MLPTLSHATSVGRLNEEPGVPDPGGPPRPPPRPPPPGAAPRPASAPPRPPSAPPPPSPPAAPASPPAAASAATAPARPDVDRLGLSSEDERDAPLGVELDDLAGR